MGAAAKRVQEENHNRYMKGPMRKGLKTQMMNKLVKVMKAMPNEEDNVRKNSTRRQQSKRDLSPDLTSAARVA